MDEICAARQLISAMIATLETRRLAIGPIDVYLDGIDLALSEILEFTSVLLAMSAEIDDPFEDFGAEPMDSDAAIRLAPEFLNHCLTLLDGNPPFPRMAMSVRLQTFGLCLKVK